MTIAHLSFPVEYGSHHVEDWLVRHGAAIALTGCVLFWAAVGVVLYFAL